MRKKTGCALMAAIVSGLVWAVSAGAAEPAPLHPTEGYLPRFTRTVKPAARERVRIVSDFPEAVALDEWPATFGVPFPRGALRSAENLRIVSGAGAEVPAQILRTATWHRPDGDLRWALVDMTAKRGTDYFVEFGTDVRRAKAPSPLRVNERGSHIEVLTGPLRVTFDRARSHLIQGAWLDANGDGRFAEAEQVLRARDRMSMTDQNGTRHETSDKPEDYKVQVETNGPRRVVIKASGWYRGNAGTGLCQYITRVHLYAGQPFVRIIHTFIVAFDTDKTQLRDIAVPFDFAQGPAQGVTCPIETGFSAATIDGPAPCWLVQDAADHFAVREGQERIVREGKRVGGWMDLRTTQGGVAVGLRNMWQDYAKELEATPQGIVAHLWPAHSDSPLDFRASSWLGPERYKKWGHGVYWQNWYRGGLDKYDQAMGLAKTNEMILAFHGPDAARARAACAALEEPPFLVADPGWTCKSDAFGPLPPRDPKRFSDIEKKWDIAFERYEFLRRHIGNYGFFDYGDVNHGIYFDAEKKQWVQTPWRRMGSRFYGICVMPWIQYARTGARGHRRWAIDNAHHVMDIDMCHVTAKVPGYPYPKYAGGRYGGNGGIIHYAGNIYSIGCDSHVSQWTYDYYMTGCRRAWDVLLEEGAFYLERYRKGRVPSRYTGRMITGALRTMLELWNATWDPRYLNIAHKLAETCYRGAKENDGAIAYYDVYFTPACIMYYQATGDERMKQLLLNTIRRMNETRITMHDPRGYSFYGPAMAYYFTGDPSYLRRSVFWMQQFEEELNVGDDPLWRGVPRGRWEFCHNCLQLQYGPYLTGALATLDKPVEPLADASTGGQEVWLNNPDGRPFTARVRWFAYARPFYWGVYMPNWKVYCTRHKPRAQVVVLDPQDRVVASTPMDFEKHPHGAPVTLEVPAGRPGLYRMVRQGAEAMPVWFVLVSAPFKQWVLPIQRAGVSQGGSYYFRVPDDMTQLSLRHKIFVLRKTVTAALLDPEGHVVKEATRKFGSMPPSKWTAWKVPVPKAHRGRLWRLRLRPQVAEIQEVLLRIDGVPPVVSATPESFFVPERIPETVQAAPRPAPLGVTTPIRTIAAGKTFVIPRGKKTGEKRYEHLNAEEGTIEFWIRPDSSAEDLVDATFLHCGALRLFRRSQLGTYVTLAKASYQSAILLRPGAWHHVAVIWQLGPARRRPALRLLVDGVQFGKVAFGSLEDAGDWTGPNIEIGSNAPLHVTGLRIADVSRSGELHKGVFSPPPDEHTLYYEAVAPCLST